MAIFFLFCNIANFFCHVFFVSIAKITFIAMETLPCLFVSINMSLFHIMTKITKMGTYNLIGKITPICLVPQCNTFY